MEPIAKDAIVDIEPVTDAEIEAAVVAHRSITPMTVLPGDVIVVRYVTGRPDDTTMRDDYAAIRDWFLRHKLRVRILAIVGNIELEAVSEADMARFGWVKKR